MNRFFLFVLLLVGGLVSRAALGQTTARMVLNFSPSRVSATRTGYREIDVLISAGTGYVSNNAQLLPNTSNPDGSWSGLNLRFTQSGATPMSNTDFTVTNNQPNTTSGAVTNITGGGSYPNQPAFNVFVSRDADGQDADATPRVLFTLQYPNTYAGQKLSVRTASPATTRDSFWSNQHPSNSGTRLVMSTSSVNSPLPVELTAFTATKQAENGLLSWTTASEKNSAYFEVQASADGRQWQPIGRREAAGSSTAARSYSLLDQDIARYGAPLVYYRLRQVDADGTASFSPLRTLAPTAAAWAVTAYPNPFAQELSAEIKSPESSPLTLELYDAAGRRVLHRQVAGSAGQQLVDLRAAALPTGSYVLHVRQGRHVGTVRLSKE